MKSFKQYFLEAKQVGILYHYTTIDGAIGIRKTNKLSENGNYVSFTRDKHFHKIGRLEGIEGMDCRFIIDGDKLSYHYRVQPFNYFKHKNYRYLPDRDEQEERIKGSVLRFHQYIIKLQINQDLYDNWVDLQMEECQNNNEENWEDVWEDSELYTMGLTNDKGFLKYFNEYCPTEFI